LQGHGRDGLGRVYLSWGSRGCGLGCGRGCGHLRWEGRRLGGWRHLWWLLAVLDP
jgi:hypothetical protein